MISQLIGVLAGFVWAFGVSYVMFSLIKATIAMRIEEEEAMKGFNRGEHGRAGYVGSTVFEWRTTVLVTRRTVRSGE